MRRRLSRRKVARMGLAGVPLLAYLALGMVATPLALAAEPPPDPDAACAKESTFKSTDGTHKATLTIINQTSSAVKAIWLDYKGKRVFYENVAPHSSYRQQTWLTHPWVIAGLDGTCYRLIVMNALQQNVSVTPGSGPPPVPTPVGIATPPPVATLPAVATPQPVPTLQPVATIAPASTGGGGGFPVLPVVGGLAALAVAIALFAAATGRLPGVPGFGGGESSASEIFGSSGLGVGPPVGANLIEAIGGVGAVSELVNGEMAHAAGNIMSGLDEAMKSAFQPSGGTTAVPPSRPSGGGGGGLSIGSGLPALGALPPGTDLIAAIGGVGVVSDLINSELTNAAGNVLSGLNDAMQSALQPASGGGSFSPPALPGGAPGVDMSSAVDFASLRETTNGLMGSAGGNMLADLQSAMHQVTTPPSGGGGPAGLPELPGGSMHGSPGVDMSRAVNFDSFRDIVNSHTTSVAGDLMTQIQSTLNQASGTPPKP